jgi:hypothetical protein
MRDRFENARWFDAGLKANLEGDLHDIVCDLRA